MLLYIIKLSISLSIVYLFYQLFLRRLTFYNWNRWYLLIYSLVCFVIPFINVFTIIVERPALRESAFINYIPAITQISPAADAGSATGANGINWLQVGVLVIVSGMLFMVVRLLLQYYSLYKMRSKAVLLYDENVKLYHINEPVMPFSFGRGIYVNQHQHSEDELKDIIRHEFIHVKQRHSLDILWSELLCILNWYNPFAWLLRHDIRQNLEFIADQQVLQTGLDRKQYQYLLLKVIGVNSFSIATNFNFSSLKRRIAMMNKTQSARVHLTRFLFLLPLLVVVLLAFRNTSQERRQLQREKQLKTDTVPAADKEQLRWKDVENIDVVDNRKVTIRLKNGKVERYDMQITKEREAFEGKYGSLPEPPMAPTPPAAPKVSRHKEIAERPEAPEKPEKLEAPERDETPEPLEAPERDEMPEAPEPPEAPLAPVKADFNFQDCINKKGYCITIADNFGECIVIVKDRDNKIVQAIFLTDWNKDKQYEEKYGEIPPQQKRIRVKVVQGRPTTLSSLKELKQGSPNPDAVIVEHGSVKPKIVLSAKGTAVPQPARLIRAQPGEVVVLGLRKEEKVEPLAIAKVDEVVVVGIKQEAKKAMSAKTAAEAKARVTIKQEAERAMSTKIEAEAKPRVTIKQDKLKAAEAPKPAPAQPSQEQ